jgi:quinol monooxygenase YgiN
MTHIDRRRFLAVALTAAAAVAGCAHTPSPTPGANRMYGLIGKMLAVPGQRDALAEILLEGTAEMPGCLSYVIATDPADENALWITEVWDSEESHAASLSLPAVREAIARGRPLIAGFGERFVTAPLGGHGVVPTQPA